MCVYEPLPLFPEGDDPAPESPPPAGSLAEARAFVQAGRPRGVRCPCCGQLAKLYKRKLNRSMAVCLVELYRHARRDFAHIHQLTAVSRAFVEHMHGGNFATMAYWGLIEPLAPEPEAPSRASGTWRVTDLGERFLRGEADAPRYVFTFNMAAEAFGEERVTLAQALGSPFDFRELMGA